MFFPALRAGGVFFPGRWYTSFIFLCFSLLSAAEQRVRLGTSEPAQKGCSHSCMKKCCFLWIPRQLVRPRHFTEVLAGILEVLSRFWPSTMFTLVAAAVFWHMSSIMYRDVHLYSIDISVRNQFFQQFPLILKLDPGPPP